MPASVFSFSLTNLNSLSQLTTIGDKPNRELRTITCKDKDRQRKRKTSTAWPNLILRCNRQLTPTTKATLFRASVFLLETNILRA